MVELFFDLLSVKLTLQRHRKPVQLLPYLRYADSGALATLPG
jgi:hypothetical protein